MAGYIGTKAVALSTTTGTILGDMTVGGTTDVATLEFNSLSGTGAVTITDILDEDNLASNSATKLATQQSIKAYVDAQVDTVDTLAEILAIGNRTAAAGKIEFRDAAIFINSSADGQLDLVADTEIQIAATTIDINGAVDVSGTLAVTGVVTANAGVVVDTMTLDAATLTATGDFTVDAVGDIVLDAAGNEIKLKDAGTQIGFISMASQNITIKSEISNKDIFFKGNDGGAEITALTLDMSAGGRALFNNASSDQMAIFTNTAHDSIVQISATAANKNSIIHFGDNDDANVGNIDYDHNINDMIINVNASECARFISEGGITFNGDTAAANALNDYEEGNCTLTWTGTGGSANSTNTGFKYVKVGNFVSINGATASTLPNATGTLTLTGLPFAANGDSSGSILYRNLTAPSGAHTLVANVFSTQTIIKPFWAAQGQYVALVSGHINANGSQDMYISCNYRTS